MKVSHTRLILLCLSVLALGPATPVRAQITNRLNILPAPSSAGLTDLNDVILFRSSHSGVQAFDGPLDPDAYRVGPGDGIEINIWSPVARNFLLTVTPEATLLIPAAGEVDLRDLSLSEARARIFEVLSEAFPESQTSVTLTEARRVRVHVAGLVRAPGTYELQANQRLSDAVARAGDVMPEAGSARRVLRRMDGQLGSYDLLSFYATGDLSENPYLEGGDHIRVLAREPVEDQLQITGAVAQPGFVEFRHGDRLSDLIRFAYGFLPRADLNQIVLRRVDLESGEASVYHASASYNSITWSVDNDLELDRGDRVYVDYQPGTTSMATAAIYGEVVRPGHYTIRDDSTTLSEVVRAAGGPTDRASLRDVVFLRPSYPSHLGGDSIPPVVSINVPALLAGDLSYDVNMRAGDTIFVPAISQGIQVLGSVVRPGILAYSSGYLVDDYVERAGGYSPQADRGGVRLLRVSSGAMEKPDRKLPPAPGDQILVPAREPSSTGKWIRNIVVVVGAAAVTWLTLEAISN